MLYGSDVCIALGDGNEILHLLHHFCGIGYITYQSLLLIYKNEVISDSVLAHNNSHPGLRMNTKDQLTPIHDSVMLLRLVAPALDKPNQKSKKINITFKISFFLKEVNNSIFLFCRLFTVQWRGCLASTDCGISLGYSARSG